MHNGINLTVYIFFSHFNTFIISGHQLLLFIYMSQETQAIEGIIPHKLHNQDGLEGKAFTSKSFQAMDKLRFLYLRNVSLAGGFKQAFKELRWFLWEYCPLKCLPSGFDAENLVILELTHSKMRTLWQPNVVGTLNMFLVYMTILINVRFNSSKLHLCYRFLMFLKS